MFKFYLDEAGEREILQQMFSGWSGCSVKERALQYGIPLDIARQCEKTDVPCPALADYLAKGYVLYRKELKQALTFHKRYWREHRLETKEKLKNIFGHKIPRYKMRFELVRNRYINQRFSIPSSGKTPPRPNIIVGAHPVSNVYGYSEEIFSR